MALLKSQTLTEIQCTEKLYDKQGYRGQIASKS